MREKQHPGADGPNHHPGRWVAGAAVAAGAAAAVGAGVRLAREHRERHTQKQLAAIRETLVRYPDQAALLTLTRPDELEAADLVRSITVASFKHANGVALPELVHLCKKDGPYTEDLIAGTLYLLTTLPEPGKEILRTFEEGGDQMFVEPSAYLKALLALEPQALGDLPRQIEALQEG